MPRALSLLESIGRAQEYARQSLTGASPGGWFWMPRAQL
jgi:hypothetical protein